MIRGQTQIGLMLAMLLVLSGCGEEAKPISSTTPNDPSSISQDPVQPEEDTLPPDDSDDDGNDTPTTPVENADCNAILKGESSYQLDCASCHGDENKNGFIPSINLEDYRSQDALVTIIHETMPPANTSSCKKNCARNIVAYIENEAKGNGKAQCEVNVNEPEMPSDPDQPAEPEDPMDNEDPDEPDTPDLPNDPDTPEDPDVNESPTPIPQGSCEMQGQKQFNENCSVCHGENNQGNSAAKVKGLNLSALTQYINDQMPSGSPHFCDENENCAANTAKFMLGLTSDLVDADCKEGEQDETDYANNTFSRRTPGEALYRTTLSLVGRVPSAQERNLVENGGFDALGNIVDELMEEEAFPSRIAEFYNEILNTEFYTQDASSTMLDWIRQNYSQSLWWDDKNRNQGESSKTKQLTGRSLGRETTEFIKYVVKNNRPITELMTADYTVVNAYTARAYGTLYDSLKGQFNELNEPIISGTTFKEDPTHWIKAKLPLTEPKRDSEAAAKIPHAGLLTQGMFLAKFPTSNTNLNRHRASNVFKKFVDIDIELLPSLGSGDAEDKSEYPTMNNPACLGCHKIMEPVAAAYAAFETTERYRPDTEWLSADQFQLIGYRGKQMPSQDFAEALPWLGEQIANDPNFLTATVKTIYQGLFGMEKIYRQAGQALTPEQAALFTIQESYFRHWESTLKSNGMSIKALMKAMVMSDWFQADDLLQDNNARDLLRTTRLLTPELLDRKISSLVYLAQDERLTELAKFKRMSVPYGGIDDDETTARIHDQNGLMGTIQDHIPTIYACSLVLRDYDQDQKNKIFLVNDPETRVENEIKENIQNILYMTQGRELERNHDDVEELYQLYLDLTSPYDGGLATKRKTAGCSSDLYAGSKPFDPNYSIRGYIGLMSVAFKHFTFFYE